MPVRHIIAYAIIALAVAALGVVWRTAVLRRRRRHRPHTRIDLVGGRNR